MMQNIDVNLAIALNLTARSYSQLIFKTTCSPSASYSAEDGEGTPQDKGFRPGGRRSFDSWQVGVSIDSLL